MGYAPLSGETGDVGVCTEPCVGVGERTERFDVCMGDPNSKPVKRDGDNASEPKLNEGELARPMSIQDESPAGGERGDLALNRACSASPGLSTLTELPFRLWSETDSSPFRLRL